MRLFFKRFLLFIVVILVIITTIIVGYVLKHRPQYEGEITLKELNNSVEVIFDQYGIPHIYAQNETDLYRAMGYIHAQERLFQMDLLRRIGSGRLSELFGEATVSTDCLFRTLGINKSSKNDASDFLNSDSEIKTNTLAYIDGINQFIDAGLPPIEYTLLGAEIERFSVEDIFNTVGYMSFSFAMAHRTEPIAQMIVEKYGLDYLNDLDIDGRKNKEVIMNHVPVINDSIESMSLSMSQILRSLPAASFVGSNSWVLSPQKTKSGKVLLANDPHIGFAQPSVWYEAHLESENFSFYGYHLAGVPFGIIGHNANVAWGFTMFENDDIDLFFEKINPDNSNQVWVNDHWEEIISYPETIRVKDGNDTTISIQVTRHGPIINNVLKTGNVDNRPVSMFWVYTKFPSRMLEASYGMARAKGLEDMQEIVQLIHAPGLNVMYGDKEGNIAWWAVAKLLKRPAHVNSKLILDGASGKDEYLGYYDFSYNPKSINPPSGYVYSANNQPDSIKGVLIPGYYLPEDRAKRIVQLLEKHNQWGGNEVMEMMNDVISSIAPGITEEILKVLESSKNRDDALFSDAIDKLKNWDGNFRTESIAPVIYIKLIFEIQSLALKDELGSAVFNEYLSTHLGKRSIAPLIKNDSSIWYDNINTEEIENRDVIFNQAMENTLKSLQNQLGDNITQWQWGKVHTLEHIHPIGKQKPFNHFFNVGPFPIAGTNEVINNMTYGLNGTGQYKVSSGPSKRRIIDFSNTESSYSILPTGQSGNFLSEYYMDQSESFNAGLFRKQMMNREEILMYKKSILYLTPQ